MVKICYDCHFSFKANLDHAYFVNPHYPNLRIVRIDG